MPVFTYRMDEREQAAADAACRKKYKMPLSTVIRKLILNHFPDAKKPEVIGANR